MLKINPQAIMHLAKLNRVVLQKKGIKYGIGEESGILELLKYVRENPDEDFNESYSKLVSALSEEERDSLGIAAENAAADANDSGADGDGKTKEVMYRGNKVSVKVSDGDNAKKKMSYRGASIRH